MKYKFNIEDNGVEKPIVIEPSIYQEKHLYEVLLNEEYIVFYQDGEEWKHNNEQEIGQQLIDQIIPKIESVKNQVSV